MVYGIGELFLLLWISNEPSSTITPSESAGISVILTLSIYQPEVASAGALDSLLYTKVKIIGSAERSVPAGMVKLAPPLVDHGLGVPQLGWAWPLLALAEYKPLFIEHVPVWESASYQK